MSVCECVCECVCVRVSVCLCVCVCVFVCVLFYLLLSLLWESYDPITILWHLFNGVCFVQDLNRKNYEINNGLKERCFWTGFGKVLKIKK